jgi:hypothetical protein
MSYNPPGRAFSLLIVLALLLTSLLTSPGPVRALALGVERKDSLCGRLVFLENSKTGEKLIGLTPCGQFKPYIFDYRPSELHDYYRLQEVVISKGPKIQTTNFGLLNTYITHFSVSTSIQDCNACNASAPTWTPRPQQASLNCADWIVDTTAGLVSGSLSEQSKTDKIRFQTNEYVASAELSQQCEADEACRARAVAIYLGSQLGEIFQHDQLPADQVIGWVKKLLSDPQQAIKCAASPQAVWHLVVGLDQQGYPIQGLQATTPLTQLIEDFSGRRTGILPDGTLAEEIPGSALVVGRIKYTLLVAGSAAKITVRGNDNGNLDLKVIDFLDENVWLATYINQRINEKTRGILEEGHILRLDLTGEGNFGLARQPFIAQYPILNAWLPTLTPGSLPSLAATATSEAPARATAVSNPTSTLKPTATQPGSPSPIPVKVSPEATEASGGGFPNPCASVGGLAALAGVGWWLRRRA